MEFLNKKYIYNAIEHYKGMIEKLEKQEEVK